MRDGLAPAHHALHIGPDCRAAGGDPHEDVAERRNLEQGTIGHGTGKQVRPDASVVHHRDIGARGLALRVGDKIAERVLRSDAAQILRDRRHRTLRELGDRPHGIVDDALDVGFGSDGVRRDKAQAWCNCLAVGTTHRQVHDRDAAPAGAAAHHRYAVDDARKLRMGMPANDGVNGSASLLRQLGHVAPTTGVALRASVRDDDYQRSAAGTQQTRAFGHDRRCRQEPQALEIGRFGDRGRAVQREADDAEFESAAFDDGVGANPGHGPAIRVSDVRRKHSKLRVTHPGAKRILAPIEVVVADGRRRVAERIVEGNHRAAEREVRRGRALKQVAPVEQHRRAGTRAFAFELADDGRKLRRSTAPSEVAIRPGFEATVEVVRRDDTECGGAGAGLNNTGRRCCRTARGLEVGLSVDRGLRLAGQRGRRDAPRLGEEVGWLQLLPLGDLVNQQLANFGLVVAHDGGIDHHPVAAGTRCAVVGERHID